MCETFEVLSLCSSKIPTFHPKTFPPVLYLFWMDLLLCFRWPLPLSVPPPGLDMLGQHLCPRLPPLSVRSYDVKTIFYTSTTLRLYFGQQFIRRWALEVFEREIRRLRLSLCYFTMQVYKPTTSTDTGVVESTVELSHLSFKQKVWISSGLSIFTPGQSCSDGCFWNNGSERTLSFFRRLSI